MSDQEKIGVVGLGYVGLPLAVAFAEKFPVVGFDIAEKRVAELNAGEENTGEVSSEELAGRDIVFSCDPEDLKSCTFLVVAVPTPIKKSKDPDLTPLIGASTSVGKILQKGMVVVYESTVYPGVTEDVCLPILEKESGLKLGDFQIGYSPERINPGDKEHRVTDIVKVVSGSDAESLDRVADVYASVITAGVHRAKNIKTAEASKVIENVQRDLNIALMNELSMIFEKLGLDTRDVLAASGTKWNFHPYFPGLVGGHCIGVDPYYLTHCAMELGYHPEVILAGRRINDSMGNHVADRVIRAISANGVPLNDANVLLLGMTFKENVPDFRNTRAVDVADYLKGFNINVSTWEPLGTPDAIESAFGIKAVDYDSLSGLDAVVLISSHDVFKDIDLADLKSKMRTPILFDVRNFFDPAKADSAGFEYYSL